MGDRWQVEAASLQLWLEAQMLSHKLFVVGVLFERESILVVEEDTSLDLEQET